MAEFDEIQLTAYSYVVGALHSPDVDAEMIVQLGSAWGGRGYHSMSRGTAAPSVSVRGR